MFGGIAFLIDGKMACGVLKDDIVLRVDPADALKLLKKPGIRPMDFTGRPMKGFLYAGPKSYAGSGFKKLVDVSVNYAASLPTKKRKK